MVNCPMSTSSTTTRAGSVSWTVWLCECSACGSCPLRIMLLLFFVPWIAAVWYLASRITSPLNSALVTFLAAAWSVPVYPTPFGSWYNLYFATFGAAALFRYIDTHRQHWLFWAGMCGGLSFLAKIFALYFIAAAGLFLVFEEQDESANSKDQRGAARWSSYSVFISLALLAFTVALIKLVRSGADRGNFTSLLPLYFHFVFPGAALSLLLIYREWTTLCTSALSRFLGLGRRVGCFVLGVAAPILVFLIPYWRRHAVAKWASSLLLSSARLHHTAFAPPANSVALLCAPALLILWANAECNRGQTRKLIIAATSVALGLLLISVRGHLLASGLVFFSLSQLLPILVLIGVVVLVRKRSADKATRERLMLVLAVAATLALVQFPVAAPIYFCFVVPFVGLVLIAVGEGAESSLSHVSLLAPLLVFYLLFGLFVIFRDSSIAPTSIIGRKRRSPCHEPSDLSGTRPWLRSTRRLCRKFFGTPETRRFTPVRTLPAFISSPDESNPTPIYMDFLAGEDAQPRHILEAIDRSGVKVVAINHAGTYPGYSPYNPSGPPPPELLDGLRKRFPNATVIGYFEIRWRP